MNCKQVEFCIKFINQFNNFYNEFNNFYNEFNNF